MSEIQRFRKTPVQGKVFLAAQKTLRSIRDAKLEEFLRSVDASEGPWRQACEERIQKVVKREIRENCERIIMQEKPAARSTGMIF